VKIQRITLRGEDGPEYYLVYIRASFCTNSLPFCFEIESKRDTLSVLYLFNTYCITINVQTFYDVIFLNMCVRREIYFIYFTNAQAYSV